MRSCSATPGRSRPAAVTERSSAQNRFIGITYVIHAQGEAQIAALFGALKECPAVLMVL